MVTIYKIAWQSGNCDVCANIFSRGFQYGQYIFDENNGLWYERHGDYTSPACPCQQRENSPSACGGQLHLRYIKEHRKARYTSLLLGGSLHSYLADIDQQAQEMLDTIVEQMAQAQGISEALKAADQMTWVGQINNIRSAATKVVNTEIIYE